MLGSEGAARRRAAEEDEGEGQRQRRRRAVTQYDGDNQRRNDEDGGRAMPRGTQGRWHGSCLVTTR
ncbi:hypothetical protein E2562_036480 [Oryza meyeriana var. granulata]|uniref:Uncharacterized protein n=1 Tax=Oryza meyeriana var. granulata TaxID=110450 RepID=A0A6G1DRL2_9ORYZ|nr:hypothetical protein E2562_036480 [Oryza meyeriana var. granulata]